VSAPSLAMWMIAKLCVFWVFSFATLHLLYSGYYLSTVTRYSTSFVEVRFQRFRRGLFLERTKNESMEALRSLLACSLSEDARAAAVGPVLERTSLSGMSVVSEKFWPGIKAPVLTQTLHATGEFPGSLRIRVKFYPTEGKSHFQETYTCHIRSVGSSTHVGGTWYDASLWCSQSGDHSQNNLAKIWLHTRYESRNKNRILLYIFLATYLPTYWNLS
jgi:hypothetical protein